MKIKKLLVALAASLTLWGCNNNSTGSDKSVETGSAQISIKSQQIGRLAKKVADIEMNRLEITLSADGETPVTEIISLSGNGASQVVQQFNDLAPLKTWTVVATSYDQNDIVIHQGGTSFDVYPGKTNQITLDLDAEYSMLKAQFSPISDSVRSLHLLLDGVEVNTLSFAPGSTPNAILDYDYLPADGVTLQTITLQAKGSYWDADYTLYEGSVDIVVNPGEDVNYVVTLVWTGPGEPPLGAAEMTVNLGAIGNVTIDGQLEADPFGGPDYSANGFEGAFESANWTVNPGTAAYSISTTQISISVGSGGGGRYMYLTIPADGVISFDWAINVFSAGQYGDRISYHVNSNTTNLSTAGTNSGSATGIAVQAGDTFAFDTWGSTQSSSYSASITNFVFTQN